MAGNARAGKFYRDLHWGLEARQVVALGDYPLLPEWTSVLGRPMRLQTNRADLNGPVLEAGFLVVDPKRRDLFVVGAPPPNLRGFPVRTLPKIAALAGGRRAQLSYPNIGAVDLGPMRNIDYTAEKKTREKVLYLHEVLDRGEGKVRAKHRCRLAWDGRMFWLLGGDYDVQKHGIIG